MKGTQRACFTLKGKKSKTKPYLEFENPFSFLKVKFFLLPGREEINHFDNPNPTLVNSASSSQSTAHHVAPSHGSEVGVCVYTKI